MTQDGPEEAKKKRKRRKRITQDAVDKTNSMKEVEEVSMSPEEDVAEAEPKPDGTQDAATCQPEEEDADGDATPASRVKRKRKNAVRSRRKKLQYWQATNPQLQ